MLCLWNRNTIDLEDYFGACQIKDTFLNKTPPSTQTSNKIAKTISKKKKKKSSKNKRLKMHCE